MESLDCVVIGAGVVGLAVARELALRGREVVVLEAEPEIGRHTSSRNSEVIHAGIYYSPGSLKARLCVTGRRALVAYLRERELPHRIVGKILVAVADGEIAKLGELRRLAEANGVDDLVALSAEDVRALEPEVSAVAGILSPSTGILDSHALMGALAADLAAARGIIVRDAPVTGGAITNGITLEVGGRSPFEARCNIVVSSAGLRAPSVARGLRGLDAALVPQAHFARGHYFSLAGPSPFKRLVYPVPAPGALGIHVTLDLAGRARFGPDISWSPDISYAFDESRGDTFYRAIRRYYPGLRDGALEPGYVGIRPKIAPEGAPGSDFVIQGPEAHGVTGLVNLFGIESPGLTACLAIANEVADRLGTAARARS
ncbi:MAG: NAD(P)/FAD-dependent oxidoreductase [Myxococcales bacterium]|nr:NAD(P)/FAD-dependent oxidoreductase [Myxococcales bacterium]